MGSAARERDAPIRYGAAMTTLSRMARYELAWCGALLLLVINDHVLKRALILPPVVTGKLSDFAGLFVAPVLLAVLGSRLGLAGVAPRLVSFFVITSVFVAVKLSSAAARILEQVLASGGVVWKLWVDPTDLIALVVLPFAWRAADELGRVRARGMRLRLHALAAALGGLGCLATSAEWQTVYTVAYLANMTPGKRTVMVFHMPVLPECADPTSTASTLSAADFEPAFCSTLDPGAVVPLDRAFAGFDSTYRELYEATCRFAVLRVAGVPDSLVAWRDEDPVELRFAHLEWNDLLVDDNAVVLEQAGKELTLTGSDRVQLTRFEGSLPNVDCADVPGRGSYGFVK